MTAPLAADDGNGAETLEVLSYLIWRHRR